MLQINQNEEYFGLLAWPAGSLALNVMKMQELGRGIYRCICVGRFGGVLLETMETR